MLTIRERTTLKIAAATYARSGRRDDDYLEQVGMTPVRAAQVVAALLERPDAEAEMPAEVGQLRRLKVAREQVRGWGRPVGGVVSRSR